MESATGDSFSQLPKWDRYTESALKALQFAGQESLHRGAESVTVADLLAGLSVEEDSRAERVGSLKANAFYLRWLTGLPSLPARLEESIENLDESFDASQLAFDLEAKRALGFAVLEADRDREYWIDSDHLLRGLLRFPNRAHFAILKTEVDLHSARTASRSDRHKFPARQNPSIKVVKYLIRKHIALWIPPILGLACYLYILLQGVGLTASPMAR